MLRRREIKGGAGEGRRGRDEHSFWRWDGCGRWPEEEDGEELGGKRGKAMNQLV